MLFWAGNGYDSGYSADFVLGCQSDSATRCIGTVTLSVRGGRRSAPQAGSTSAPGLGSDTAGPSASGLSGLWRRGACG